MGNNCDSSTDYWWILRVFRRMELLAVLRKEHGAFLLMHGRELFHRDVLSPGFVPLLAVNRLVFITKRSFWILKWVFPSTGGIISKTMYELIYHSVAFILYLIASILLMIKASDYHRSSSHPFMIASVRFFEIKFQEQFWIISIFRSSDWFSRLCT